MWLSASASALVAISIVKLAGHLSATTGLQMTSALTEQQCTVQSSN
jgi:hypothetical protein